MTICLVMDTRQGFPNDLWSAETGASKETPVLSRAKCQCQLAAWTTRKR